MAPEPENKQQLGTTATAPQSTAAAGGAGGARPPALGAVGAGATVQAAGAAAGGAGALVVCNDGVEEPPPKEELDTRLDRLPMRLDAMVKVHSFRVQDLLSMEKGTIVETVHEHTQDMPVSSGGALLVWAEFEVLDQRLAVRITRLA